MNRYIITMIFLLLANVLFAQQKEIKGTVTDGSDKSGLPGVTVVIKGSAAQGTVTDINGNYQMKVNDSDIIVFSFIGMKSQEIPVKGKSVINVSLVAASEQLEDVIVMGYTTRKKGTVSGAVTTIGGDVLKVPVVSFDQALQGQVAGMTVMTSSGSPDASSSVRIRGSNSINAGKDPLYIMDGVAIGAGDFSALNSADIESLTVLKDASSTSIYGARAANGVIVITTKRGKVGERTSVTYSGKYGISKLAYGQWDMMNTSQLLDYEERVGLRIKGQYDRAALEAVNVDWRDILYNDKAPTTSHDLSIRGAGDKSNYYISLGYMDQDGVSISSGLKRYNVRGNIEVRPTPWLKAGLNTTLGYTQHNHPQSGQNSPNNPSFAVYILQPYMNPYNADGSISDEEFVANYGLPNPLATAADIDLNRNTLKLIASTFLEVKPIPQLSLKTQFSIDGSDYRSTQKVSPNLAVQNGNGLVSEVFSRSYTLMMTNLINFTDTYKEKHNVNVLLGQEVLKETGNGFSGYGEGYTDDRLMILGSTVSPEVGGGSVSRSNFLSFFGRGEYNYDYKYFLDISLRGDGSSRFGENSKWATFWSAGMMWDLKKETFMESVSPLTSLQLSYNLGTSGNSSIGNYEHLAIMAPGPIYNGIGGVGASTLGNPNLTWEKILTHNIGLKVGLFNRIRVSVEWYNKKTTSMLMSVPVSMVSGFANSWQNIGKMQNRGFEFDINADAVKAGEFNWNVSANFSRNQNKILELYNGLNEYVMQNTGLKLTVGHDVHSYYMVRFAGVDPLNGDPLWLTKNGEITNQYSDDHAVLMDKSMDAPWVGGFTNTFSYKGVSLQAFFSWVSGRYMVNMTRYFTENNGGFSYNQSNKMFRSWTPENRYTDIPRYGAAMTGIDDRLLEDASFMRLKNLTLSWSLPKEWLSGWSHDVISAVRIYGQGQNLLTWTNYSGLDPEVDGNNQLGNYPNSKTFLVGIDITF